MKTFWLSLLCFCVTGLSSGRHSVAQESRASNSSGEAGVDLSDEGNDSGQPIVVPKSEAVAIAKRLKNYAAGWIDWVDHVCHLNDQQKADLALLGEEVRQSGFTEQWTRRKVYEAGLAESLPLIFQSRRGLAKCYLEALQKRLSESQILTIDQMTVLHKADQKRCTTHHEINCGRIMNLYDRRLNFLPEERVRIQAAIVESRPVLASGMYVFSSEARIPLCSSMELDSLFSKHLSADHAILAKDLSEQVSTVNIRGKGVAGLRKSAEADVEARAAFLRRVIANQMAYYRGAYPGNEELVHRLEGVAAEIEKQILDEWKEKCFSDFERYGQDKTTSFSMGYTVPNLDLDAHLNWTLDVMRLPANEVTEARSRMMLEADTAYRLLLLDEELWLQEEQIEKLRGLVSERLQYRGDYFSTDDAMSLKPFVEMAHMLHLIQESELNAILSPVQMEIWRGMKDGLSVQKKDIYLNGKLFLLMNESLQSSFNRLAWRRFKNS